MSTKVKDLVNKPEIDKKTVGSAVKDLISKSMSKGNVKSLKIKVKMGKSNE